MNVDDQKPRALPSLSGSGKGNGMGLDSAPEEGAFPSAGRRALGGYPGYNRATPIQPEKNSVREYWRILRKHRWTVLATLFVMVSIVTIGTLMSRPVYRAQARIEIGKETERVLAGQRIMELETANVFNPFYLQTQVDILRSRDISRRVIQRLNLAENQEFQLREAGSLPEHEREVRLVNAFQGRYDVAVGRQSRVVTVSFDSYSPVLAADVANTVAGEYIAWSMESRLQGLGTTREFLSRRVEEARNELRASEEAYTRYLTDRRIISLDDRGNIALARTEELNRQLVEAENERRSAEAVFQRSRQVSPDELPPVLADPTIQALTRELSRQRQEMANLSARYQPGYTAVRQVEEQVKQLDLQLTEAKQRIVRNVETQFRIARAREDDLRGALLRSKGETIQQNRESTELNLIKQKTETDRKNYEDLLQRLRQAEVESDFRPANMRIVQRAEVPIAPVRPNRVLNIGLGLLIGLALGIGMAFFIEYLNNTINTVDEVERILLLPSLGAIPSLETLTRGRKLRGRTSSRVPVETGLGTTVTRAELVSTHESVSSFAESYRALRTSLLLSSAERAPRIMLVTSSYPAEGKTTIASNTAISLAQTGARVLVLDADMRRPRCHRILRVPNEVGLSTYLSREVELERAIQPHEIPTLSIMPAGPIPPNPSELLSSPKLRGLLAEAQDQFDHIIIDSPPVIQVSDALIISPLVDGVVLVVKSGQTPREVVLRAKQALFDVNAKIFGVVLNGINLRADGYYYNYKYSYDQSYPEN